MERNRYLLDQGPKAEQQRWLTQRTNRVSGDHLRRETNRPQPRPRRRVPRLCPWPAAGAYLLYLLHAGKHRPLFLCLGLVYRRLDRPGLFQRAVVVDVCDVATLISISWPILLGSWCLRLEPSYFRRLEQTLRESDRDMSGCGERRAETGFNAFPYLCRKLVFRARTLNTVLDYHAPAPAYHPVV